jgi:hypothetical protein
MAREFPFPLPDGWFQVAYGHELTPGAELSRRYFGSELRVSRSPAGALRASGAARVWPCCERNGMVWVWRHGGGGEPDWAVPEVPEWGDPAWTGWVVREWRVRTRNQEIAENTSDPAHFQVVHAIPAPPAPDIRFAGHEYRSSFASPGGAQPGVPASLDVHWFGLGIGITRTRGPVDSVFIGTLTPIDAESVHVRFSIALCRALGFEPETGLGRATVAEIVRQMEQDIPIWENKVFRAEPLLCEADGPIPGFRRWARQFYSAA